MAAGTRLPWAALAFAGAALLSAWNPLAAPFGLVVGLAAALIAVRAWARGLRRPVALGALVVALVAAVASVVVLARTAGVGRKAAEPVVAVPSTTDVELELGAAAERTKAARGRARGELDGLQPKGAPGAPPAPKR